MPQKVLILGAGLAGLAAAWTLQRRAAGQVEIELLDRGHVIGGKASSMPHKRDDVVYQIDHGLHVYFQYPNFDKIMEDAGGLGGLRANRHRMWVWKDKPQKLVAFQSWPLPSPLHWGGGMKVVGVRNAMKLSRVMLAAAMLRPERVSAETRKRLDELSWEDFGRELGVPPELLNSELYRFFGRSGFHHPYPASAFTILRATRLVSQSHAALVTRYLDGPMGEIVVTPMQKKVVERGAKISRYHEARQVKVSGGRVTGVMVAKPRPDYPHAAERAADHLSNYHTKLEDIGNWGTPEEMTADWYIGALPPEPMYKVLEPEVQQHPYFAGIREIKTQPTIAYQVYYDRIVTPPDFTDAAVALPGAFSTLFDRARIWSKPDGEGSIFEWVSEIGEFVGQTPEQVMADADRMAEKLFPAVKEAKVLRRFYHEGGHDRFTMTLPGSDAHRPHIEASPIENLVLAGDYTNNSFGVVCMEGAVTSGIEAANVILRKMGLEPEPVLPMEEPGGLVPALRAFLRASGLMRRAVGFEET